MSSGVLFMFSILTSVTCSGCSTSQVEPSGAVKVAGGYSLSVTAASTCQQLLWTQVGTDKSTPIDLTQNGTVIAGTLNLINPPTLMSADVSGQIVSGNVLSVTLRYHFSSSHIGVRDVAGSGIGTVSSAGIAGTFGGSITEFAPFSSVAKICNALDHQFVLSRVGW